MNWLRLVCWVFWRGIVCGAAVGAVFGTFFGPIVGTIIGALYGGALGLGMGIIDGLVLATMTTLFFNPPNKSPHYLVWTQIVSVALNFVVIYVYARLEFPYSSIGYLLAVMAAIPAYFLCPRFVKYALSLYQQPTFHDPQIDGLHINA